MDTFDDATAQAMKRAGCFRVFFGIESGNDDVLRLMDKRITTAQARAAVETAHRAGLEVGAFFILCYPGETDDTVLDTLRFATSLPLDYVGLTMPYPLPGTALLERVGGRVTRAWRPQQLLVADHELIFASDFSALKMHAALLKGRVQVELKRRLGRRGPAAVSALRAPHGRPLPAPQVVEAEARCPRSGVRSRFAANALIVSSTRRRSQASSISEG